MKIITASTLGIALSLFLSFVFFDVSKAQVDSDHNQNLAVASASPTLTSPDNSKKQKPSPTSICSPSSTPLSVEEKYPFEELDLEDAINMGLGTPDWDCDGVVNIKDNCIFVYNPDQKDSDSDGKGDVCNPKLIDPLFTDSRCDEDGDGIPDNKDNCLLVCNPDQKDVNKNRMGDVCDPAFPNAILGQKSCAKRIKVKAPKPPKPKKSGQ